jgi:beta-phosphoglucomutase
MSFDVARFDLFLFDFDGLLVDTERVHWKAYKLAGKQYDIEIDWEFEEYCVHSHYSDEQMRQRFREHYPKLKVCCARD